jgi:hypothetical protein
MENKNYAIIDSNTNICKNIVVWDGVSNWHPGNGLIVQLHDGIINTGDVVEFVNGSFQKAVVQPDPPGPSPEDLQKELDAQALRTLLDNQIAASPDLKAQQDKISAQAVDVQPSAQEVKL